MHGLRIKFSIILFTIQKICGILFVYAVNHALSCARRAIAEQRFFTYARGIGNDSDTINLKKQQEGEYSLVKKEMIAMLLAGGQGSRLGVLTQKVAKPAVSFGGKYRIIDFPGLRQL